MSIIKKAEHDDISEITELDKQTFGDQGITRKTIESQFKTFLDMNCTYENKKFRGRLTGNDWKLKYLQNRYGNHFVLFLRKIKE